MTDVFAAPIDLSALRDKVALVTGGASGLGRATAIALAEVGVEVVVADVDADGGEAVARQVDGHFVQTDVADLDSNRAAVAFARERCGRLDLAHLNAGVTSGCGLGEDFDLAAYRRAMSVNLDGVVFGTHAVLAALRENDPPARGAIVATASLAGLTAVPMEPLYSANKHAVVGLARSLGPALAHDGIRFNAVCPGFAVSAMTAGFAADLEVAGIPLIPAEVVAATVVRLFALDVSGECWFVQPGREPAPFAFRNVPGPRAVPNRGDRLMDFETSDRAKDFRERLQAFLDERVYPAETVYVEQLRASGTPHFHPPVMEELKEEARKRGLWNLFMPDPEHGPGLTNLEYAPLAELLGRTLIASEACNCSAPDTGNMEVLAQFGDEEQKERWLRPLLDGEIRSAFAMTEPDVASSDATNISLRMERDGDDLILNGRKWWTTNVMHPNCKILIVMGKTELEAPVYAQQSMVLVPLDTPGLEIVRSLPVFGYMDSEGHGELKFTDVRVPQSSIVAAPGAGFLIAQARLGPGRIHHCMRAVGAAERALELMCKRADERETFGKPVSTRSNIRDWIAEARIELEMLRLLVLKTAWLVDTVGGKNARIEVAAIKVAAPNIALKIIDRAIQVHGGAGVSDDTPLAYMYAHMRTLRLADGPDEVHKLSIARRELRRQRGEDAPLM